MNAHPQLLRARTALYPRDRRNVAVARDLTLITLADWGLTRRTDDVLLCVSELVTNALLHGVPPGRHSRLLLRYDGRVLGIEVHDSGPGVPRVVDDGDTGAEGGRGLLLVAALSDKWGVRERELGKAVWCEFLCDPLPAPAVRGARAS